MPIAWPDRTRVPIGPARAPATAPDAAELAREALIREIHLTPKPGLVDRRNTGAHRDMDHGTFMRSIDAISGWFAHFCELGHTYAGLAAAEFLPLLRPAGMACEQAMFRATAGVNTHKGGVFAFGLLCAASGRLQGRGEIPTTAALCSEVAAICAGIVERELAGARGETTVGEHLYRVFGLTGARGEAASGYGTVRTVALPVYRRTHADGCNEETALLQTLLHLLAHNRDTNVVARGGMAGLAFVQRSARELLARGGMRHPQGQQHMAALDDALIARNLSPGGSADLLAVTWFLAHYA